MRLAILVLLVACNQIYGLDGTRSEEIVDTDRDGVPDDRDNCPDLLNSDQADEDRDTIGNVCDNCPLLANRDQAQAGDTDRLGDVCDPHPEHHGDCLLLFDSLDNAAAFDAHWMIAPGSSGDVRRETGFISLQPGSMRLTIIPLDDANAPFRPTQAMLSARASAGSVSVAVGMTSNYIFKCGVAGTPPMQMLPFQLSGRTTNGPSVSVATAYPLLPTVGDNLLVEVRGEQPARAEPFFCIADYGISFAGEGQQNQMLQDPTGVLAVFAEDATADIYAITATVFVGADGTCPEEIRR